MALFSMEKFLHSSKYGYERIKQTNYHTRDKDFNWFEFLKSLLPYWQVSCVYTNSHIEVDLFIYLITVNVIVIIMLRKLEVCVNCKQH